MALDQSWFDRAVGAVAPGLQLKRLRARILSDLAVRHYEGAAAGRRTQNWNRASTDPNAALQNAALSRLRDVARDLVRNNPYAESAVTTIADHAVGTGIMAKPQPVHASALAVWKAWAETTACDADGRQDIYGLQKLVMATVVESGEALVRRRMRRVEDGLMIPMQIQVLEPDYLDSGKTMSLPNGGYIIQGIEYNAIGQRVAYWLFPSHPGSSSFLGSSTLLSSSRPVPASEVLHVFKVKRAGQVRAPSWFAPVILRMKDFDEFEDATIMKQKVAACLAVLTTDVDGTAPALGTADDTADTPTDTLSPGAVMNMPPGRSVQVVDPPRTGDYEAFSKVTLRAIAAGLHVAYEDLTGDYTNLPFSAARMSRLRHQARVNDWRWRMLIPQFCDPVWAWLMEVAAINGLVENPPAARWTPEPLPFIDPAQEGLAVQRNVRSGIQSMPEAIRERGYDPDELLEEIAEFNKKLDALGIVLDTDPRKMSQAGQQQSSGNSATADGGGAQ